MGAGAMLVGIAWRSGGGRPPLALMAIDAFVMGAATFVGSVTGALPWVHFAVLCLVALLAGLLVGVGNRGAVVGTQAIIAVVVFGRFSEPAAPALGLAGLVFAGGCAQVLFVALARWPSPLRTQRDATAAAYRALATLAAAPTATSSLPAGEALDQAACDALVAAPVRRSGGRHATRAHQRRAADPGAADRHPRAAGPAARGPGRSARRPL